MSETTGRFRVALTADFFSADGSTKYPDIGLSIFERQPHIEWVKFREHKSPIDAVQVAGSHGVIVLTPSVTAETVVHSRDLLAIGRFGVGYDAVDVAACTQAEVVVFITAGAVDRSVAEATVGWMIALTHHFRIKDHLVRTGRWDERSKYMGRELRDRTFGSVGLGGIGRATLAYSGGVRHEDAAGVRPLTLTPRTAEEASAEESRLDQLLAEADFVSIHCPLTKETRGLIGRRELALMTLDAYLIKTARGGIVDEDALYDALSNHRIAGVALDCFADEPVVQPRPLCSEPATTCLLAPHSIAWTDELFRDIGRSVCQGMVDLSLGKVPRGVVNPGSVS